MLFRSLKSCCLHLLWYETGGGHTGSGVDFEQMNLIHCLAIAALAFTYDVVDTYDTVAVENVIDMTGEFGIPMSMSVKPNPRFSISSYCYDYLLIPMFAGLIPALVNKNDIASTAHVSKTLPI